MKSEAYLLVNISCSAGVWTCTFSGENPEGTYGGSGSVTIIVVEGCPTTGTYTGSASDSGTFTVVIS